MPNILLLNKLDDKKELLTVHDLFDLGLYPSPEACHVARRRGHGPDYVKNGRKILYPRESVINFVNKQLVNGSVSKSKTSGEQQ